MEVAMSMQMSEMRVFAAAAIGDKVLAEKWLATPSTIFEGSTPLAAISTVDGCHRVMRQLAWFAGKPFSGTTSQAKAQESLVDLLNDPMMDLILRRAGTNPDALLRLWRPPAEPRRAAA
jgi:hypothetical protein